MSSKITRLALIIITVMASVLFIAPSASALSGSEFNAERIIDDTIFFNPDSMSAGQIQSFLNARLPNCDTNGSQPYGGTSRAAYGASRGYPAPYTCLKDYSMHVPAKAADSYCGPVGAGTRTAAEIIYTAAQACGVSPKVLIVLLQKEQSLITDDWPWSVQYEKATGYGCPDTAPCDPEYAGLFNQLYYGARQYQRYARQAHLFNYAVDRTSFVAYQANNPGCGGTNLTMRSQATAGLYNYTPYQPNAAALNNLYGTGDSCSAYGNRNFWRMYNDWFGNTRVTTPYAWRHESNGAYSDAQRTKPFSSGMTVAPGEKFYLTVRARNYGNQTWNRVNFHLGTLGPTDRVSPFADPTWLAPERPAKLNEATVAPGQVGTFTFTMKAPQNAGTYNERFGVLVEGQQWLDDLGVRFTINVVPTRSPYPHARPNLTKGQTLKKGQYLISQDAQSVFAFLGDGNLMLFQNYRAVWDSQTSGRPATKLVFQNDGNLVLSDDTGKVWWQSGTSGTNANLLTLETVGNLVLYNSSFEAFWETHTHHTRDLLGFANQSMRTARLYPGQQIETPDRRYKLLLQEDGNLVLYSPRGAIWASGTDGRSVANLSLLANGNLVLHDNDGNAMWQSRTAGAGASRLVLQEDGNLVLYNDSRPTWNTETVGR